MDAYAIYIAWWKQHYGYECPITREAWDQWCRQPNATLRQLDDTQFDIDTERREGWSYGEQ